MMLSKLEGKRGALSTPGLGNQIISQRGCLLVIHTGFLCPASMPIRTFGAEAQNVDPVLGLNDVKLRGLSIWGSGVRFFLCIVMC